MKYALLLMSLFCTQAFAGNATPCKSTEELSTLLNCDSNAPQSGCKQVGNLQQNLKCSVNDLNNSTDEKAKGNDFLMKKRFGPTACSASNTIEERTTELTGKCEKWTTSKKDELKDRYRTSTCEESCVDCSTGLKKCEVNGVIHYNSN